MEAEVVAVRVTGWWLLAVVVAVATKKVVPWAGGWWGGQGGGGVAVERVTRWRWCLQVQWKFWKKQGWRSKVVKEQEKTKKTHKRRSTIWLELKEQELKKGDSEEDVKAMCLHCDELYLCHTRKHGISNLNNHMERCKRYLERKSKSQTHIIFEGGDANKMMAWKFDQNKSKRALAYMIVVDELPFSFVRNLEEEKKLRETLQKNISRVSLTTDGWTSDDMKKVDNSIEGIRYAVKWIKKSGTKIEKWNSTYAILEVAHVYEDAFTRNDLEDVDFGNHIRSKGHSVPTLNDWTKAKKLCHFLKAFYEITLRISKTTYVTSHALVNELATIRDLLRKQLDCEIHDEQPLDKHLYDIAKTMQPKFDKYYYEVENMNLLVYFAFVLDPRNKYDFLDVIMEDHYGREGLSVVTKKISKRQRTTDISDEPDQGDMLRNKMKMGQSSNSSTSKLDKYVGEICEPFDKSVQFDILQWWKINSQRFPILLSMARDVLVVPISTVTFKSVFSTSGRVLDSYRSSLGDKMIECLICTQDWLRIGLNPQKDEDFDTITQIEKALMEQEALFCYCTLYVLASATVELFVTALFLDKCCWD
uniref:Zinc finger BED domain-containing protein RICESLEEPER 2-like n=1 Tax=Tanacetum cinerariifolium TaxID=118510 RepID=A0A6L2N700_TANCI|nr:zinc finger BED domain-containing protein RICESLEEPER 2-like [Tanacetum cinerariifolium]